jgi:hypothetical protein
VATKNGLNPGINGGQIRSAPMRFQLEANQESATREKLLDGAAEKTFRLPHRSSAAI